MSDQTVTNVSLFFKTQALKSNGIVTIMKAIARNGAACKVEWRLWDSVCPERLEFIPKMVCEL